MSSLFSMLSTKAEEHVKGSSLAVLSKVPSRRMKHGLKDLGD